MQIIHSMQGADINAIRDRMSQSIRIQLDLVMASDDAAFILARLQGKQPQQLLPEAARNVTVAPPPPGLKPAR